VLEVLRELLAEGRDEEVLALVSKLVARNSELERRLAQLLLRGRKSERVSSAQLLLLLDQLTAAEGAKELDEANLMQPLWRAALWRVLSAKVMHLDGTSLPVLDRDSPAGKKLGALWGYVGDQQVAAVLYTSTAKKLGQEPGELGPEDVLRLRRGYVVADASNLFDLSFKRDELIECGCNMHARRYFVKALDGGDTRAALPLAAFSSTRSRTRSAAWTPGANTPRGRRAASRSTPSS
jgi:hypothetical protein